MAILRPGDEVTVDCQQTANFPFGALKDKSALAQDIANEYVGGRPPLASDKTLVESVFGIEEITVCEELFPVVAAGTPLKLSLRITDDEEPPPPPTPSYRLAIEYKVAMIMSEWAAFGGGKYIYRCESPVLQAFVDAGISHDLTNCPWTPTGCYAVPGSIGPCICGKNFEGSVVVTPVGGFNPVTGEVGWPVISTTCYVRNTRTGTAYQATGPGSVTVVHPSVRCPTGFITVEGASVQFVFVRLVSVRI